MSDLIVWRDVCKVDVNLDDGVTSYQSSTGKYLVGAFRTVSGDGHPGVVDLWQLRTVTPPLQTTRA